MGKISISEIIKSITKLVVVDRFLNNNDRLIGRIRQIGKANKYWSAGDTKIITINSRYYNVLNGGVQYG